MSPRQWLNHSVTTLPLKAFKVNTTSPPDFDTSEQLAQALAKVALSPPPSIADFLVQIHKERHPLQVQA